MSVPTDGVSVVWFRRDLRVHDHPALAAAIRAGSPIAPLFVLDPTILHGRFASPNRVWFMLGAVRSLAEALEARGSRLTVRVGRPEDVVPAFASEVDATSTPATTPLSAGPAIGGRPLAWRPWASPSVPEPASWSTSPSRS